MPSNVSEMRLESKPRIVSVPPAEPNGIVVLEAHARGCWLIVSRIELPGVWREMNAWLSVPFALAVSETSTPPTPRATWP